jgi:KUP system potassium uptake protein
MVVFLTTCMVSIAAVIVWRLHLVIVLPVFFIFVTLDGLFLSSSLVKVSEGAWFTLMLAVVVSIVIFVWRYGKEKQWKIDSPEGVKFSQLILRDDNGNLFLNQSYGGGEVTMLKGRIITSSAFPTLLLAT